jgi:hypothetical protein
MVFMSDSRRAAKLAKDYQLDDVGLHLNFSEEFTDPKCPETLKQRHKRIIKFFRQSKYAQLLYNPFLRQAFAYAVVCEITVAHRRAPSYASVR